MQKRDEEKCKWQREERKAMNNLHNSKQGSEDIAVTCVHVPVTVHRSGQCRISYV